MIPFLLGIGSWLKSALSALLRAVSCYPWQTACIALLAASLWFWHGKGQAIHQRDAARAETKALEVRYTAAQAEAAAKALKARADAENHYKEIADDADTKAAAAYADGRSAAQRYIDTHRVRACPAPGASSGTAAAAQGDSAQGADRSGDSAVVVAEDDVNICTSNSLRLQAAHDWALRL